MKAKIEDVTIDNFKSFNFDDIDFNEIRELFNIPDMREAFLNTNMSPVMQERLYNINVLSEEECVKIIQNSDNVWGGITNLHNYSSELLLEFGHKLRIYYIEKQPNITPEFVEKHGEDMDISGFIAMREQIGDIDKFLHIPVIKSRYLDVALSWRIQRSTLESLILSSNSTVDQSKMKSILDNIFLMPITESTLTELFSRPESNYSVSAVLDYFKSHSSKTEYANWDEYVFSCKECGRDSLASIIFNDFYRRAIVALINN